ncbi:ATP phosphoribosyltransferase regulatory subunit [Labeo rohita]|uniref:ATP phosphoribosyltransferase regulatory subunit n=1 Tax=Labeo rohita TaxID=84645 RepID=A0ABQ8L134_LABRO|nr:ATP phosphoribosyltransferase regulatory subunit [Labeo rohita]
MPTWYPCRPSRNHVGPTYTCWLGGLHVWTSGWILTLLKGEESPIEMENSPRRRKPVLKRLEDWVTPPLTSYIQSEKCLLRDSDRATAYNSGYAKKEPQLKQTAPVWPQLELFSIRCLLRFREHAIADSSDVKVLDARSREYHDSASGDLDHPSCIREVHIFCDASERACGCVEYLRTEDPHGKVEVAFIMSSSRVAPKKHLSVPRLLQRELTVNIAQVIVWIDSTTVLTCIRSDFCHFKVFVGTRVTKILELTNSTDWRYVDSLNNPADDITKGEASQVTYVNMVPRGNETLCRNALGNAISELRSENSSLKIVSGLPICLSIIRVPLLVHNLMNARTNAIYSCPVSDWAPFSPENYNYDENNDRYK